MTSDEPLTSIANEIERLSGYKAENVTESTRVYQDAGVSGEDLYDLMIWFSHRYKVKLDGLDLSKYSPPEAAGPISTIGKTFKVLHVGDLIRHSSMNSWEEYQHGEED